MHMSNAIASILELLKWIKQCLLNPFVLKYEATSVFFHGMIKTR